MALLCAAEPPTGTWEKSAAGSKGFLSQRLAGILAEMQSDGLLTTA